MSDGPENPEGDHLGEAFPYEPGNRPTEPENYTPGQAFPRQPNAPLGGRKNPETLEGLLKSDEFVDRVIEEEFAIHEDFPLSADLPENPSAADWKSYEEQMAGYQNSPSRNPEFFQEARKEGQVRYDYDSIKDRNPSVAWKLHLNVRPEDVQAVADFLKRNAYHHKYLSGGDPGNTFTIYIGSYRLASKSASEISSAIEGQLCKPVPGGGEIEMACGVAGRFVGSKKQGFHQYGSSGMSMFKDFYSNLPYLDKTSESYKGRLIFERRRAFRSLVRLYGDYFLPQEQIMKYA